MDENDYTKESRGIGNISLKDSKTKSYLELVILISQVRGLFIPTNNCFLLLVRYI